MQQMPVPTGLQTVLDAAQAIKPVSSTGQPTVASQILGAAQQQQAGLPQIAQGVRTAAPMVNQRMQDERLGGVLQRLQQAQARPAGIEGLDTGNAIQGFADGGIVGFDGEEGSYVRSPEETAPSAAKGTSVAELLAALRDYLRGKGTVYDVNEPYKKPTVPADKPEAKTTPPFVSPEAAAMMDRQGPRWTEPRVPPSSSRSPSPSSSSLSSSSSAARTGIAALTDLEKKSSEDIDAARARRDAPFSGKETTPQDVMAMSQAFRKNLGLEGLPGASVLEQVAELTKLQQQQDTSREAALKKAARPNLVAALSSGSLGGIGRVYAKQKEAARQEQSEYDKLRYMRAEALSKMRITAEEMKEAEARGQFKHWSDLKKDFDDNKAKYTIAQMNLASHIPQVSQRLAESVAERPLKELEARARIAQAQAASRIPLDEQVFNLLLPGDARKDPEKVKAALGVIRGTGKFDPAERVLIAQQAKVIQARRDELAGRLPMLKKEVERKAVAEQIKALDTRLDSLLKMGGGGAPGAPSANDPFEIRPGLR